MENDDFSSKHDYGTAGYFVDLFAHYPADTKVRFFIPHEVLFVSNYKHDGALNIDLETK